MHIFMHFIHESRQLIDKLYLYMCVNNTQLSYKKRTILNFPNWKYTVFFLLQHASQDLNEWRFLLFHCFATNFIFKLSTKWWHTKDKQQLETHKIFMLNTAFDIHYILYTYIYLCSALLFLSQSSMKTLWNERADADEKYQTKCVKFE